MDAWEEAYRGWLDSMVPSDQVKDNNDTRRAFRVGFLRGMEHASQPLPEPVEPLTEQERSLLEDGKLITVIKMVRNRLGVTLKDAKAFVDQHKANVNQHRPL